MRGLRIVFAWLVVCAFCTVAAARERDEWRISVGASVIGGVETHMGASAARMVDLSGFSSTVARPNGVAGSRGKDEAYRLGAGLATENGKRIFDGGAWYDPHDSGEAFDGGYSWNWRLHDPSVYDATYRGFVERTAYHDVTEPAVELRSAETGAGVDSTDWLPGLRVEAARELYASEGERPWGVDIAVAFAYYFQCDVWEASGTAATSEASERDGYYEWRNDSNGEAHYILDYYRDTQFDGSMWGAGTFDGPGAELPNTWSSQEVETVTPVSHTLGYHGSGDYREYSIEVLARPWWEPWEWLRVFGSVGVDIARREFDWSLSARGSDGSSYAESGDASDWCVRGLLGGGLELRWKSFFIVGEVLWRFGGVDLPVEGRAVSGEIGSADFGARLGLGYSF